MSKRELALLRCGNCGHQFEAGIWAEFHVEHDWDPCGSINYFECEECGWGGPVRYPLKVVEAKDGKAALFVPPPAELFKEDDALTCFEVVLLGGESPIEIVHSDFRSIWKDVGLWGVEEDDFYYAVVPSEESILEGVERGIIDEEDAELLRRTDWEAIRDTWPESPEAWEGFNFSEDVDRAMKVNFRLMMGLR